MILQGFAAPHGLLMVGMLQLALAGGCTRSADDRFVRVEGTVRIGGVPVERGSISFVPLVAVGRNAVTTEITEGRYLAENVPVGNVRAVITATKETGNMVRYFDKSMPETIELVPLRLRSGIDVEINASSAHHDFDLEDK